MNNSKNFQQLRDENIDLGIIGKGFISLYYNENVINHDIDLLKNKKYKVIEIDGDFIFNRNELHFELQNKLKFPDYGNCFDALDDYLIDFEINKKGVVIVFKNLNNVDLKTIHILLDIFACHARRKFAIGQKLLVLIQVNNPKFKIIEPIGAINFYLWNDKEWFESDRL